MEKEDNKLPPSSAYHQYDHALHYLFTLSIFKLCGLPPGRLVKLDTVFKPAQENRIDMLFLVEHDDPAKNYLTHIEIQTTDHPEMELRMFQYLSLIYGEKRMNVRQFVVYAGGRPSKMKTRLKFFGLDFCYHLIDLTKVDSEPFLQSPIPEEVILGLLCKYPNGEGAPEVVVRILEKIKLLKSEEPHEIQKYIRLLNIIAQLRNLQDILAHKIKEIMIESFYDPKKDPFYWEVLEEGEARGEARGEEKAVRKNIERLLIKQLLTDAEIADALEIPLSLVESIKEKLIADGRLKD